MVIKDITDTIKNKPLIIDKRTGIINSVRQIITNEFPDVFTVNAIVNNTAYYDRKWPCDRAGSGTAYTLDTAINSAIGEAIERYCGNIVNNELIYANVNELQERKKTYYKVERFVKYSEAQYQAKGFPFKKQGDDEQTYWIEGKSLLNGEKVLVPASLAYVNYWMLGEKQKKFHFPQLSGIASGTSYESAILSGLGEVIERDITMKWWISSLNKNIIEKSMINDSLSFTVYQLGNTPLLTIAAFLWDDLNMLCNVGFSSRFDLNDAVSKAKSEAIQLRNTSLSLLNNDQKANKSNILGPEHYLKEFKMDRSYEKDYRKDYKDMYDLIHNTQYYLDPNNVKKLEKYRLGETTKPNKSESSNLKELIKSIGKRYENVIVVDLTTSDVLLTPFRVVRVLVTDMISNSPTAYPPLGFFEESEIINLSPLPHS